MSPKIHPNAINCHRERRLEYWNATLWNKLFIQNWKSCKVDWYSVFNPGKFKGQPTFRNIFSGTLLSLRTGAYGFSHPGASPTGVVKVPANSARFVCTSTFSRPGNFKTSEWMEQAWRTCTAHHLADAARATLIATQSLQPFVDGAFLLMVPSFEA